MAAKHDWAQIKTEYVTSLISLRAIAAKYNVPFPTVRDRSRREKWVEERKKAQGFLAEKTVQKVVSRTSRKIADVLARELQAADLINEWVLKALQDDKQFNRHLVQIREKSGSMKSGITETWDIEEREFEKIDTKALKDLADALAKSTELKKSIMGIIEPAIQAKLDIERQKLDIDRENLAIAKTKAGLNEDEGNETGIAEIPAVDLETYEAEKAAEIERLKAKKAAKEAADNG